MVTADSKHPLWACYTGGEGTPIIRGRSNVNTIRNSERKYWLDIDGCLQPCPYCGRAEPRPPFLDIAHSSCFKSMSKEEQVAACKLHEALMEEQRECEQ